MKLAYIGPDPAVVGVVPLPEGWPAATHEDEDEARIAAKLETGFFREATDDDDDERDPLDNDWKPKAELRAEAEAAAAPVEVAVEGGAPRLDD